MSDNEIQSLHRAIQILEYMAERGGAVTLREIASEVGLPKSTTHRILATLRAENLVEQQPMDGTYRLGLHLFELGCSIRQGLGVTDLARPYLQKLGSETGESVCLALLNQGEALILEFLESASAFHVVTRAGASLPVHCTVQGKVMLAHLSGAEVRRILRERGMKVYTPNTIDTYEKLAPELDVIRKQGFAVENGEFHTGLCSVAAPIRNASGTVCYSVAVVSMFHRIGSEHFERAKKLTIQMAEAISRELGYNPQ